MVARVGSRRLTGRSVEMVISTDMSLRKTPKKILRIEKGVMPYN